MKNQKGQIGIVLTLIAMGLMTVGIGIGTWAVKSPSSPFYTKAAGSPCKKNGESCPTPSSFTDVCCSGYCNNLSKCDCEVTGEICQKDSNCCEGYKCDSQKGWCCAKDGTGCSGNEWCCSGKCVNSICVGAAVTTTPTATPAPTSKPVTLCSGSPFTGSTICGTQDSSKSCFFKSVGGIEGCSTPNEWWQDSKYTYDPGYCPSSSPWKGVNRDFCRSPATPTATPTPNPTKCGNGVLDQGEMCDKTKWCLTGKDGASGCQNACLGPGGSYMGYPNNGRYLACKSDCSGYEDPHRCWEACTSNPDATREAWGINGLAVSAACPTGGTINEQCQCVTATPTPTTTPSPCKKNGESCPTPSSFTDVCCSGYCNNLSKCDCEVTGEICQKDSNCCEGYKCDSQKGWCCAKDGTGCSGNEWCCSGKCVNSICVGAAVTTTPTATPTPTPTNTRIPTITPSCSNLNSITDCQTCVNCRNAGAPNAVWCQNIQGNPDADACVWDASTCTANNGTPATDCATIPTPTPTATPTSTPTPGCPFKATALVQDASGNEIDGTGFFTSGNLPNSTNFDAHGKNIFSIDNLANDKKTTNASITLSLPGDGFWGIASSFCSAACRQNYTCPTQPKCRPNTQDTSASATLTGFNVDCGAEYSYGWKLNYSGPTFTPTPTVTITLTPSTTPTPTVTTTPAATATPAPTTTPGLSATPTVTGVPPNTTPTVLPTPTLTGVPTATSTPPPTSTPTLTPLPTCGNGTTDPGEDCDGTDQECNWQEGEHCVNCRCVSPTPTPTEKKAEVKTAVVVKSPTDTVGGLPNCPEGIRMELSYYKYPHQQNDSPLYKSELHFSSFTSSQWTYNFETITLPIDRYQAEVLIYQKEQSGQLSGFLTSFKDFEIKNNNPLNLSIDIQIEKNSILYLTCTQQPIQNFSVNVFTNYMSPSLVSLLPVVPEVSVQLWARKTDSSDWQLIQERKTEQGGETTLTYKTDNYRERFEDFAVRVPRRFSISGTDYIIARIDGYDGVVVGREGENFDSVEYRFNQIPTTFSTRANFWYTLYQPTSSPRTPTSTTAADIDQACEANGVVNARDYFIVIFNYGKNYDKMGGLGDVNHDRKVNGKDLSSLYPFMGKRVLQTTPAQILTPKVTQPQY